MPRHANSASHGGRRESDEIFDQVEAFAAFAGLGARLLRRSKMPLSTGRALWGGEGAGALRSSRSDVFFLWPDPFSRLGPGG